MITQLRNSFKDSRRRAFATLSSIRRQTSRLLAFLSPCALFPISRCLRVGADGPIFLAQQKIGLPSTRHNWTIHSSYYGQSGGTVDFG